MAASQRLKEAPRHVRYGTAQYTTLAASLVEDEAHIARLQGQISALKQQIKGVRSEMALKRVSMSHAAFLPLDILSHTFSFLRYEFPRNAKGMRRLASVSKAWRDAVFHTPSLWSQISLGTTTVSLKRLEAWVSRAGALPLDIHLHIENQAFDILIPPDIKQYLSSNTGRIGELTIGHKGDEEGTEFLVDILSKADRLRKLSYNRDRMLVYGIGQQTDMKLMVTLPSLRSLAYNSGRLALCHVVAPQLISLDLKLPFTPSRTGPSPWNFPLLSSLSISITHFRRFQNANLPATQLPKLRDLACRGMGSVDIAIAFLSEKTNAISKLTAPTAIFSLASRIPHTPSLKRLTIIQAHEDEDEEVLEDLEENDIVSFMGRFPNLDTLELWIGRHETSWSYEEKFNCDALKLLVNALEESKLTELRFFYDPHLIQKSSLTKIISSYDKAIKKRALGGDKDLGPRVTIQPNGERSPFRKDLPHFRGALEWHQFSIFISSFVPKSW
jgi:hypothetical protein